MLTTGFGDAISSSAIIFTFQTFYGYLYFQIGILITLFMMASRCEAFSSPTDSIERPGGISCS